MTLLPALSLYTRVWAAEIYVGEVARKFVAKHLDERNISSASGSPPFPENPGKLLLNLFCGFQLPLPLSPFPFHSFFSFFSASKSANSTALSNIFPDFTRRSISSELILFVVYCYFMIKFSNDLFMLLTRGFEVTQSVVDQSSNPIEKMSPL